MAFSADNINKVKSLINRRRVTAESEARQRLAEVYEKLPELKEIDASFPNIGSEIVKTVAMELTESERTRRIDELRKKSEGLEEKRAQCLKSGGYSADYTAPRYACKKCSDMGYVGVKMCDCMRRECILCGYESSGLGVLLEKQSFDNFSLNYYEGDAKRTMEYNVSTLKKYVSDFDKSSPSLMFMGNTGLGKTHLSTAVARGIIDRGFDVQYVTSQNLIASFSRERFGHSYGDAYSEVETAKFFSCELLVIDDFGTEECNQFSVSVFYNLINSRINLGKPIIVNTNLSEREIRTRYADRITSRLFGEFLLFAFPGRDIRMQNLGR